MSISTEVHERFFQGCRTDEVRFVLNDAVNVTSGPYAGRFGAVISILSLDPEVTFLVESLTPPYCDVQVRQSDLELDETAS